MNKSGRDKSRPYDISLLIGKWHNTIIRNHLVRKTHLHRFHQVRQFFAILEEKRLVFRNAAIEAEKCLRKRVKSTI